MPQIEVDDEVYERIMDNMDAGETESDVMRRLLGLEDRTPFTEG